MSNDAKPEISPAEAASQYIRKLAMGFAFSRVLGEVAALGIADLIKAHGPQSAEQLVERLAAKSSSSSSAKPAPLATHLHRTLRILASVSIFREQLGPNGENQFALTPEAEVLCEDHELSCKWVIGHMGKGLTFEMWSSFGECIRQGKGAPQIMRGFASPFEWINERPDEQEMFQKAMKETLNLKPEQLSINVFAGFQRCVDVGGSFGHMLRCVLQSAGPESRGVLFDLPYVVEGSRQANQEDSILGSAAGRVEYVGGDFFVSIPAGDCFVISRVIHDWPDDKAVQILSNCAASLQGGPQGRVFINDVVVPEFGSGPSEENPVRFFMDLHMMVVCNAKERTKSEFIELLSRAGLELVRIVPIKGHLTSIIEAKKKAV